MNDTYITAYDGDDELQILMIKRLLAHYIFLFTLEGFETPMNFLFSKAQLLDLKYIIDKIISDEELK